MHRIIYNVKVFKRIFLQYFYAFSLTIHRTDWYYVFVCERGGGEDGVRCMKCAWNNFMRIIKFICVLNATRKQKSAYRKPKQQIPVDKEERKAKKALGKLYLTF